MTMIFKSFSLCFVVVVYTDEVICKDIFRSYGAFNLSHLTDLLLQSHAREKVLYTRLHRRVWVPIDTWQVYRRRCHVFLRLFFFWIYVFLRLFLKISSHSTSLLSQNKLVAITTLKSSVRKIYISNWNWFVYLKIIMKMVGNDSPWKYTKMWNIFSFVIKLIQFLLSKIKLNK